VKVESSQLKALLAGARIGLIFFVNSLALLPDALNSCTCGITEHEVSSQKIHHRSFFLDDDLDVLWLPIGVGTFPLNVASFAHGV